MRSQTTPARDCCPLLFLHRNCWGALLMQELVVLEDRADDPRRHMVPLLSFARSVLQLGADNARAVNVPLADLARCTASGQWWHAPTTPAPWECLEILVLSTGRARRSPLCGARHEWGWANNPILCWTWSIVQEESLSMG